MDSTKNNDADMAARIDAAEALLMDDARAELYSSLAGLGVVEWAALLHALGGDSLAPVRHALMGILTAAPPRKGG